MSDFGNDNEDLGQQGEPNHYDYRVVFHDGTEIIENGYCIATASFVAIGTSGEFGAYMPRETVKYIQRVPRPASLNG